MSLLSSSSSPASSQSYRHQLLQNDRNFHKVMNPELTHLWNLFDQRNYQLRIAGGAVRDLLLNIEPHDVDLATTATPTQMIDLFTREQIRMFNSNGCLHGTVSVRIDDKANFEITTLRIDEITDGRHAKVKFTTDWEKDAERRDLTINSMFLDRDGTLIDYFGGYDDVMQRKVRFVGNVKERICEDYLRILRYFRFHGRVARCEEIFDPETVEAIKNHASGLGEISGERIHTELRLILLNSQAPKLIRQMVECGVHQYIGLPCNMTEKELELRWLAMSPLQPHQSTVLATLLSNQEDIDKAHRRLKFSNEELRILTFIVENRERFRAVDDLPPYQHEHLLTGNPKSLQEELLKYFGREDLLKAFREWNPPRFPVNGRHISNLGIRGPRIGIILKRLRELWIESGTTMTCEELIEEGTNSGIITHSPSDIKLSNKS